MQLDTNEILEAEFKPDKQVLVIWFLKKSLLYAFVMALVVSVGFMLFTSIEQISTCQQEQGCESSEALHPFSYLFSHPLHLIGIGLAAATLVQLYFIYLRRTYRYLVTNKRCIFVGGILVRIERSIPFQKITDTQKSQNIIERMLGIWNVQVFTPGTASLPVGQLKARAEINFDGLTSQQADDLYARLNHHAANQPGSGF